VNNVTEKKYIYDLVIIGSGPAGLACAIKASEIGIDKILIVERGSLPGGILPQCIHSGFGLKTFNKELTGPEYNQIFIDKLARTNVSILLDTMALDMKIKNTKVTSDLNKNPSRIINIITASRDCGYKIISTKSLVLSLGCRERTRGQIMLPGSRPSGIFTAGLIQRMVNIDGYLPGKEIIILGSGDIGLIMARRLTLEGCNVKGVYEIMPFSTGLLRNISQCLDDYNINLQLSHTVSNIIGEKQLEAVEVCSVDTNLKPISSRTKRIQCDTLLLSVGLIPENELSKTCGIEIDSRTGGPIVNENFMTSQDGIFSCGNSLFVNDVVDNVTEDGYSVATNAADFLIGKKIINCSIEVLVGKNISYIVPQKISGRKDIKLKIRAKYPLKNAKLEILEIDYIKKLKYINPGELIIIELPKSVFNKLKNNSKITVNIIE